MVLRCDLDLTESCLHVAIGRPRICGYVHQLLVVAFHLLCNLLRHLVYSLHEVLDLRDLLFSPVQHLRGQDGQIPFSGVFLDFDLCGLRGWIIVPDNLFLLVLALDLQCLLLEGEDFLRDLAEVGGALS